MSAPSHTRRRILIVAAIILLAAQLFQPDRTRPVHNAADDLIAVTHPTSAIADLLHTACYDCHSDETIYPWYSYITPVDFWLQHHVTEGRDELNMSTWAGRSEKWQRHKAKEAVEMLEDGSMPTPSYTWLHREAALTDDQRGMLVAFFRGHL